MKKLFGALVFGAILTVGIIGCGSKDEGTPATDASTAGSTAGTPPASTGTTTPPASTGTTTPPASTGTTPPASTSGAPKTTGK